VVRNQNIWFKRRDLPVACADAGVVTGEIKTIEKFVIDKENLDILIEKT